jgi:23S rRNA (cytosine1962-C5)-methyltransferase
MKDLPDPPDFPPEPGREPHLKSVLVTVEGSP